MNRQTDGRPLVSVILTTRDRPRFLDIALACYAHQTYPDRELIVVDDGQEFPVDPDRVAAAGGKLVRVPPGTPLGTKLNAGVREARGVLCQKMDDDDWYAANFMEKLADRFLSSWETVCRPTIAFLSPFLFFDLARWELRRSIPNNIPGATLLFARSGWEARPFRPVRGDEDLWFVVDQTSIGALLLAGDAVDTFLAVRHGGAGRDRSHTWLRQATGQSLEDYLTERPVYPGGVENLLPAWAIERYRDLQRDLI